MPCRGLRGEQPHVQRRRREELFDSRAVPKMWNILCERVVLQVQVAVAEKNVKRLARTVQNQQGEAKQDRKRIP